MKQSRRKKRDRGFSLIEVLVAIAIVVTMTTVATIGAVSYLEKSKKSHTQIQIRTISDRINEFRIQEDSYPEELSDLVPDYIENANFLLDGWKRELYYQVPGDNGKFDLVSAGSDGNFDTIDDNINNWDLGKPEDDM